MAEMDTVEEVEADKRFDGKWVLQTNTDLPPAQVALKYKVVIFRNHHLWW